MAIPKMFSGRHKSHRKGGWQRRQNRQLLRRLYSTRSARGLSGEEGRRPRSRSLDITLTQCCQTGFLLHWIASCRAVWMQCWRNPDKQSSCYSGWHPAAQYGCNADAILPNRLPFMLDGILLRSMDAILTQSWQTGLFVSCDPVLRQCCPDIDT